MNFKIIQFGIDRYNPKESKSMGQLKTLGRMLNVRYIRIENPPYDWDAPVDNIFKNWTDFYRGRTKEEGTMGLTDRHYGCWLSHKQSIMLGFSDKGHSLICESDCRIFDMDLFKDRLQEAINFLNENPEYHIVRFEPPFYPNGYENHFGKQVSEHIFECKGVLSSHCYLINENSKEFFTKLYEDEGWTASDDWLNFTFKDRDIPLLAFKEKLTFQFDGSSEVDYVSRNFDNVIKNIDESIKNNL